MITAALPVRNSSEAAIYFFFQGFHSDLFSQFWSFSCLKFKFFCSLLPMSECMLKLVWLGWVGEVGKFQVSHVVIDVTRLHVTPLLMTLPLQLPKVGRLDIFSLSWLEAESLALNLMTPGIAFLRKIKFCRISDICGSWHPWMFFFKNKCIENSVVLEKQLLVPIWTSFQICYNGELDFKFTLNAKWGLNLVFGDVAQDRGSATFFPCSERV